MKPTILRSSVKREGTPEERKDVVVPSLGVVIVSFPKSSNRTFFICLNKSIKKLRVEINSRIEIDYLTSQLHNIV